MYVPPSPVSDLFQSSTQSLPGISSPSWFSSSLTDTHGTLPNMSFKISAFSSFVYHILLYVLPRIPPSAALLAREASALSTITPTPASTPGLFVKRGVPSADIGSTTVSAYSSWTTWSCSLGSTWSTQAPYGRCRTTDTVEIPMWTGCVNTSVAIGPFDVSTCTGTGAQTSCVTGKVLYNHNVTLTNYECWTSWTGGNWEASATHPTARLWQNSSRRQSLYP